MQWTRISSLCNKRACSASLPVCSPSNIQQFLDPTVLARIHNHGRDKSLHYRRWVHHGPSHPTKSSPWERKAVQVKNTDLNNPYLDLIRDTHDPSMQLKTLEDELKGTIGKALGKQGEKILYAMHRMREAYQEYEQAVKEHHLKNTEGQGEENSSANNNTIQPQQWHPYVVKCAERYNLVRQEAIKARWELLVHRQAVGLIVNNHQYVMKHYPINDAIPIPNHGKNTNENGTLKNSNSPDNNNAHSQKKKIFGDQLSWWQNVGRWR